MYLLFSMRPVISAFRVMDFDKHVESLGLGSQLEITSTIVYFQTIKKVMSHVTQRWHWG